MASLLLASMRLLYVLGTSYSHYYNIPKTSYSASAVTSIIAAFLIGTVLVAKRKNSME